MCSAVTVVLWFVPVLRGCVWYVCSYVRKNTILQCLQLLRGKWTCYFHMCGSMLLSSGFKHAREECESKTTYVFEVPDVYFVRTL